MEGLRADSLEVEVLSSPEERHGSSIVVGRSGTVWEAGDLDPVLHE